MTQPSIQKNLNSRRFIGLVMVAALCLLTGCGSEEGPERMAVSGKVTLDGVDLKSGVIRFVPQSGTQGPAASATVQDGRYAFDTTDGPIAGSHRVEIEATDYMGFEIDDELAFAKAMQQNRKRLPVNPVPANYNRQSTLHADVKSGETQELNFDMTTPTARR